MDIKKVAYGSGRSCFLEIVTNVCSQKSLIYLDTKYHNLLDILTEYTSEDNCDSFHDEWMARQCQPNMNKFLKEAENPTGNVSLYDLCDNVANPESRARIQNPESRIQNPESRIQNPESRIQNPESRIQNPESRIQNPESRIQNPESRIQNPESRIQNPESRIQNPESRIQNPESRIQNPESRIRNDCYSGLCHVNQDLTEALDEFCDMVEAKALEPKTFYSCMVKILKSDANLEYDCVRAKNRGSNGTEITMADRAVFMVDKECTRTVMEGMCETTAMSTFDEDWEKQQNSARNQSQII
ncbi:Protein CBG17011 [Caenorhabditis briggsae]|uniref:Protein CBG17011 n=1 Tax=Caenorhabditis briggsae TaxID=6238 RepID=A8XQ94_CAEBR|nr:Protein CBG17011 [Caenorhabditis briggsae]CAP34820.1 Protein CBG17011 [Caenorhabditis briggsae]